MPANSSHPANKPTALITGASSGLGREVAIAFARKGINVLLSGRNVVELAKTQDACVKAHSPVVMTAKAVGDLRSSTTLLSIANFAHLLNCKYAVHCAAVYCRGVVDQTEVRAEDIILPNVIASIEIARLMYAAFVRNGGGTFCNINSSAGKNTVAQESYYAASKHAMTGFMKAWRADTRNSRAVRVMDVFLGGMKTPMMADRDDYEYLMEPAEVAEAILANILLEPKSFQVDELTLSRFNFPVV